MIFPENRVFPKSELRPTRPRKTRFDPRSLLRPLYGAIFRKMPGHGQDRTGKKKVPAPGELKKKVQISPTSFFGLWAWRTTEILNFPTPQPKISRRRPKMSCGPRNRPWSVPRRRALFWPPPEKSRPGPKIFTFFLWAWRPTTENSENLHFCAVGLENDV